MEEDGVVIDADVMSDYYKQSISEEGDIFDLIEKILLSCGIAVSEKILYQWMNTTGNIVFERWLTNGIKTRRIVYIKNPQLNSQIRKEIHNKYGLPRPGRDIEYIKVANKTKKIRYILTRDIDFYDPQKKQASRQEKYKVKNQREGDLCKYLKKKLKIRVGLPEHCCNDLKGIFPN